MSEQIDFLKKLLDYVDSYQKEVGNSDMKEFAIYLRDKQLTGDHEVEGLEYNRDNYLQYKEMPKVEFSTLLTSLYRFARHYVKKAFQQTNIKTIDEFGFLATLLRDKSLLKNELIRLHFLEVSSGSEILKRLLKMGLIYEYPDPNDGRAKRVSLTEKGSAEIMTAFDEMYKVSEVVAGNLTDEELTESLAVFNKLNYFHIHIHEDDKETNLDKLYQKYVLKGEEK